MSRRLAARRIGNCYGSDRRTCRQRRSDGRTAVCGALFGFMVSAVCIAYFSSRSDEDDSGIRRRGVEPVGDCAAENCQKHDPLPNEKAVAILGRCRWKIVSDKPNIGVPDHIKGNRGSTSLQPHLVKLPVPHLAKFWAFSQAVCGSNESMVVYELFTFGVSGNSRTWVGAILAIREECEGNYEIRLTCLWDSF